MRVAVAMLAIAASGLDGARGYASATRGRGTHLSRPASILRARALALGEDARDAAEPPQSDEPAQVAATSVDLVRMGVLLSVPLAWGTYAPAVKIAYAAATEPAVPGLLLSAGQYLVAFLTLSLASAVSGGRAGAGRQDAEPKAPPASERATWLAAFELGLYLFVANFLQISGLALVPTDRAGFLVQTTTLMVPLIDATLKGGLGRLPMRTWAACLLAFSGVVYMSGGAAALSAIGAGGLQDGWLLRLPYPGKGDCLILGSAVIYSVHVIRLSALAPRLEPLRLAPRKAASELALATVAISTLLLLLPNLPLSRQLFAFFAELQRLDGHALALLAGAAAWMGAVTTGYTIWAQTFGQGGGISAPVASIVYSSQPLWSALFAYLLLGESLAPQEAAGGTLVVAALLLGATSQMPRADGGGGDGGGVRSEADGTADRAGLR
jgi:drug/metabolite transporter (DMT)-like permease